MQLLNFISSLSLTFFARLLSLSLSLAVKFSVWDPHSSLLLLHEHESARLLLEAEFNGRILWRWNLTLAFIILRIFDTWDVCLKFDASNAEKYLPQSLSLSLWPFSHPLNILSFFPSLSLSFALSHLDLFSLSVLSIIVFYFLIHFFCLFIFAHYSYPYFTSSINLSCIFIL